MPDAWAGQSCRGGGAAVDRGNRPVQPVTEPLLLTDMADHESGLGRASHGYTTSGTWVRLARRAVQVALEVFRHETLS